MSQPMAVAVWQVGVTAAAEVAAGDGGNGSEGSVAKPVATAVSKAVAAEVQAAALTTVPMAKLTAVAVTTELTVKMTVVPVVATETVVGVGSGDSGAGDFWWRLSQRWPRRAEGARPAAAAGRLGAAGLSALEVKAAKLAGSEATVTTNGWR